MIKNALPFYEATKIEILTGKREIAREFV